MAAKQSGPVKSRELYQHRPSVGKRHQGIFDGKAHIVIFDVDGFQEANHARWFSHRRPHSRHGFHHTPLYQRRLLIELPLHRRKRRAAQRLQRQRCFLGNTMIKVRQAFDQ